MVAEMNVTEATLECTDARETILRILNGDQVGAENDQVMKIHLDGCLPCKDFFSAQSSKKTERLKTDGFLHPGEESTRI